MPRRLGSRDRKKRRRRKDRFRKMRKYHGHLIPYHSKRTHDSPIKIWWWQRIPMSQTGRMKWNKYIRPKVIPYVYLHHIRVDVDPERLSNKQAIEQLALETVAHEGYFLLMLFSHGKNTHHVKPVKGCQITIINTKNGLIAKMGRNYRMYRYWYWKRGS